MSLTEERRALLRELTGSDTYTVSDTASRSWAVLSGDDRYRYRLGRRWDDQGELDVWVMLNPSTADAERDDPTIRRCIGFSRTAGAAGFVVLNLFALRATDPVALTRDPDPIGPENDEHIARTAALAGQLGGRVIAAWGAHPMADLRGLTVRSLVLPHASLLCLGTTKHGAPRHPLYVKGDTALTPWSVPR